MNVRFYVSAAGRCPPADYMRALADPDRAKLTDDLRLIQRMGIVGSGVTTRPMGGRLYEVKSGAQRAFYVMVVEPEEMVVLHIYKKASQKAPKAETDLAEKRMKEEIQWEADRIQKRKEREAMEAKKRK